MGLNMCRNNIRRGILNEFTTLGLVVIATLGISIILILYATTVIVLNLII